MAPQIKLIIFVVVTAGFVWLSRGALRDYRSHGFYRFFAWESILILALLNAAYWFDDPFSVRQIASWILLTVSAIGAIGGIVVLHRIGKPDHKREDATLMGIEKTTVLVTVGVYRYVRHPLYGSLLFGAWGVFLKQPTIEAIGLTMIATSFLIMTARREEVENIQYFGEAYQNYMKRTRMFIPFLF